MAFMGDKPEYPDFNNEPRLQARRQRGAADGRSVDWHVAEKGAVPFFERRVEIAPNMSVYHTPPRARWRLF